MRRKKFINNPAILRMYLLLTFNTDCRCVYIFTINYLVTHNFELTENSFLKTNGIYNNFPTLKFLKKYCNFSRSEE